MNFSIQFVKAKKLQGLTYYSTANSGIKNENKRIVRVIQ